MPEMLPPNAEDVRKIVEERLAALDQLRDIQETVTVEWRSQQQTVPVISMPLELLSYNPDTHRIRAQRSLDPERDQELRAQPFGGPAQAYLHQLLMGDPSDPSKTDPSFDGLKDDLQQHGQNDPGIISRAGVLINGNTRCAALKELGQRDIRVGVLPADAGFEDLQNIELSLQLRKDHRRDYSFMNSLLAIDERVEAGWPPEQIQKQFRIRSKTFERSRWILEAVREVIERSRITGASGQELSMRLIDFERHQGKLEELYRTYTSLKSKSPEQAEALKEQRLLAIALDKSKTDVRWIDPDFSERYMQSVLPAAPSATQPAAKIPGTSISVAAPSAKVQALRALTTQVVQSQAVAQAPDEATPEMITQAEKELKRVDDALDEALDKAGKTGRVVKKRFAPVDRLSDVNDSLELTVAAVAEARASGNLDPEDLDDALRLMQTNMTTLAQLVVRDSASNADGIAWLKSVGSLS